MSLGHFGARRLKRCQPAQSPCNTANHSNAFKGRKEAIYYVNVLYASHWSTVETPVWKAWYRAKCCQNHVAFLSSIFIYHLLSLHALLTPTKINDIASQSLGQNLWLAKTSFPATFGKRWIMNSKVAFGGISSPAPSSPYVKLWCAKKALRSPGFMVAIARFQASRTSSEPKTKSNISPSEESSVAWLKMTERYKKLYFPQERSGNNGIQINATNDRLHSTHI